MKKQVWLNMNTGEFSNSWKPEETPSFILEQTQKLANENELHNGCWKLITYTCDNDPNFEFYNSMQIKTSDKLKSTSHNRKKVSNLSQVYGDLTQMLILKL